MKRMKLTKSNNPCCLLHHTIHLMPFLTARKKAECPSHQEASSWTYTQQTSVANDLLVTSSPPTAFVGWHSQSAFPTSQSTPPQALPVLSAQEPQRTVRLFSPVYTKTSFSFRGQNPLIIPTASATQPEHHSSTTKRLLWECSNLHSVTLSRLLFSKLLCPTYRCTRED